MSNGIERNAYCFINNYDHLKYSRKPLVNDITKVDKAITECKGLISIFAKSIETARKTNQGKTLSHFLFYVLCYLFLI
ncbi:MAG: hypothetical protein A2X08_15385 [Bacteroidetes bacterium GWA2_32_17]|nr:MAG: hypothetical protein A2X08_15385 [Bacteroidetes bacterium GWA2_32_17]